MWLVRTPVYVFVAFTTTHCPAHIAADVAGKTESDLKEHLGDANLARSRSPQHYFKQFLIFRSVSWLHKDQLL